MTASKNSSDNFREPIDSDLSAKGRFDARPVGPATTTADPRWRKLGIAAALGLVAAATLFPTQAQGRHAARQRPVRRG